MVTGDVPVFLRLMDTSPVVAVPGVKLGVPNATCSVSMNPTVKAPIHAATAMLTATVTAMSMIDATTGLRAFVLFFIFLNVFISLSIPPLGLMSMLDEVSDLNLTT